MSSLIKDVKSYLVSQLSYTSTDIFLSCQPDAPDNIISISKYAGGSGGGDVVEHRIQIAVRNTSYATAESKTIAIRNLLDPENPESIITLGTSRPAIFVALQEPFFLREDNRKRSIWCCNFEVTSKRDS